MSANGHKTDFPVSDARRYLEPGPVVLITSKWQDEANIMTLGWQTIMEFSPSLVGCMISAGNHSHELIRRSGECGINLPTTELTDEVAGIGNTSGAQIDKFAEFKLTQERGTQIEAPLIRECHAQFECRLYDDALVEAYNFLIFEIVAARVEPEPEHPETLHYMGGGVFRIPGGTVDRRSLFTKVP